MLSWVGEKSKPALTGEVVVVWVRAARFLGHRGVTLLRRYTAVFLGTKPISVTLGPEGVHGTIPGDQERRPSQNGPGKHDPTTIPPFDAGFVPEIKPKWT